jgi:hypothetical protein
MQNEKENFKIRSSSSLVVMLSLCLIVALLSVAYYFLVFKPAHYKTEHMEQVKQFCKSHAFELVGGISGSGMDSGQQVDYVFYYERCVEQSSF